MLIHATQEAESVLPPTNDARRAAWARRYFGAGMHRNPVEGCPQPETPIRQRAYAAGQHNTDTKEIQK